MGDQSIQQRLAAVLAADVVGYTRLMEQDSEGTVTAWQSARDGVINPTVSNHSGRIVKEWQRGPVRKHHDLRDGDFIGVTVAARDKYCDGCGIRFCPLLLSLKDSLPSVSFWLKADSRNPRFNVRFTPESGH